ncbi:MAG TPA: CPBP family intramembrane glutamic endopeptidase [Gemmatimonadaceae bacterium]
MRTALATVAVRLVDSTARNPLLSLTSDISNTALFAGLVIQYVGYFAFAGPIDWWHRRSGPSGYGLTRANQSWKALVAAGVATAVLTGWPSLVVDAANAHWHLGQTVAWRQALFDMSWRRWQFWFFSAVGSWAVVPVVEELFFHGYCQRRLAEDWGDGPAIVGTACLFACSHAQYFRADPYNAGLIFSVFAAGVGYGVVFALTRSLVPSIFAHAVLNVPMTIPWQLAVLFVSIVGWIFSVRPAWSAIKKVFAGASITACIGLGILSGAYAIASKAPPALAFVALGMVIVAIVLEKNDRIRVSSTPLAAEGG